MGSDFLKRTAMTGHEYLRLKGLNEPLRLAQPMRLKHATMRTHRNRRPVIALPAPCTLLINFLQYQLSFHVLKLFLTNSSRSDDCNKESSSGMFSRQKSYVQREPFT